MKLIGKIFLLIFSISVNIQMCNANSDIDSSILNRIGKELSEGSEISFFVKTSRGTDILYESTGKLLLYKENFRLRIGSLDICYNDNNLTYYDLKENSFTLLSSTKEELLQINPILILLKAEVLFEIEKVPNTKEGYTLELIPKTKDSIFKKIRLHITKKNIVNRFTIDTTDGTFTMVSINKITPKKNLSPFSFIQRQSQYPNAEIIDLR